jgi:hypothetical protein
MPLAPRYSNTIANAAADAMAALHNGGTIRFYDGAQPANADTAVTSQVLLAEITFNATAFGAAAGGVATANAFTQDSSANASGTATWYRTFKSDGTTALMDGSIGTSGSNINMVSTSVTSGQPVQVTAFTITFNKS